MKRFLFLASLVFGLSLSSCEKDEPGKTATAELAGQWSVVLEAVDENNELVYADDEFYGIGHFLLLSYNTSDNVSDEMFVESLESESIPFKVKVNCNVKDKSFASDGYVEDYNEALGSMVISDGEIFYGAATTPSGMKADSICFYFNIEGDTDPEDYGFAKYRVAGYRYTGLASDEE